MEFPVVITHGDADGIISLALFLKHLGNSKVRIYFSSTFRLLPTICESIKGGNLERLYVFDLSGNERVLRLASTYDKALWIDHHNWNVERIPENVELVLDNSSPSASMLVSKYFSIESELVEFANQIDMNAEKCEEALFLRDLIASLKWKFKGKLLANKLKTVTIKLAFSGLEALEKSSQIAELLSEYKKWIEEIEKTILPKVRIFNLNGNKVALFETFESIPIYVVNNKLLEHEEAPFDLVAVIMHKPDMRRKNIGTKIELRTQTDKNIFPIAESLGGGGHLKACAATLPKFMNAEKFVEFLKENFKF